MVNFENWLTSKAGDIVAQALDAVKRNTGSTKNAGETFAGATSGWA
jgi:hypothetical protein